MKKFTATLLAACLILSCATACKKETGNDEQITDNATSAVDYVPQELVGGKAVIPDITIEKKSIPSNDAMNFVKDMKIGWSLGNTFDAVTDEKNPANEMNLESAWCGVKTTKEMLMSVKAAGFNTLRLPVSWHNHVDDDFNISKEWLDRVQEVLDYAIECDLYVILNIHHDNEKGYLYPSSEYIDSSKKYVGAIWTQLADRFKDYDNHLVFEGMNEPRLKGTNFEWWLDKNNETCKDSADCINQLNQLFVDTVRKSGGNNADRYLMVPSYCAKPDAASYDSFVLPTDTADNKLIVSIHAYEPYSFALQGSNENGSTDKFDYTNEKSAKSVYGFMDTVYNKYVANGIPVIIGEFGARNKSENLQARVDLGAYYIAEASSRGIVCCVWDNHAFSGSGENFGLLDRSTNTWKYPDVILAMMKYAE